MFPTRRLLVALLAIPLLLTGCRSDEERASEVGYDQYSATPAGYEERELEIESEVGLGRVVSRPHAGGVVVTLEAPREAYAGEEIDFVVRVVNQTDLTATKVQIEAQIAPELNVLDSPEARWEANERILAWNLGTLEPGAERLFHFRALTTAAGTLENCIDIRHNFGTCLATEVVAPAIECQVIGEPDQTLGEVFQVRLVARNVGTGVAQDVVGRVDYSAGLSPGAGALGLEERPLEEGDMAEPSFRGGSQPLGSATVEFGDIPAGESVERTIELQCSVPGSFRIGLDLQGYPNLSTTCSLEGRTLAADLMVEKTGPAERYAGQEVEYRIRVSSVGDSPARNVVLRDRLPEATRFVSASGEGAFSGDLVQWNLGDLAPGETRDLSFVLRAFCEATIENCAVVTAEGGIQKEACARTLIFAVPAMAIENVDTIDPVPAGAETTYKIRVINEGDKPTTGVVVNVELPQGSEFVSGRCELSECTFEAQRTSAVFQPIGRLEPGQAVEFDVTVRFLEPGDMVCSAVLTFAEFSKPVRSEEGTTVYGGSSD